MPAPRSQGGLGPVDSGDRDKVPSSELRIWRKTSEPGPLGILAFSFWRRRLQRLPKGSLTCLQDLPQYQAEVQGFRLVLYADLIRVSPSHIFSHPLTPSLTPEGLSYLQNPLWGDPGWLICFQVPPLIWMTLKAQGQAPPWPWWITLYPEAFCFARSTVGWD